MLADTFLLLTGLACAGFGGEWFIRGMVDGSRWLRIAPTIAGVTLAAFATSSPELSVAINAALKGTPQLSLGDALGSNVVNIALVLALALLIKPMSNITATGKRDLVTALSVPALLWVLTLDGNISRFDSMILLILFSGWLLTVIRHARRDRLQPNPDNKRPDLNRVLFLSGSGLLLLILAGWLIVSGAVGLAQALGFSEYVIGAVLVAVGTSIPELAATIIASWRGHQEIGLGNILGSNIFNGLLIVPVAGVISPYQVSVGAILPALLAGALATLLIFPGKTAGLGRRRAMLLLALYLLFLGFTTGVFPQ